MPAWRTELKQQISRNKHRVYRDPAAIAALEDFLCRVARGEAELGAERQAAESGLLASAFAATSSDLPPQPQQDHRHEPHVRACLRRSRQSPIIDTILGNLRPGVEAIVLDADRPAARQIAAALEDRSGLDAVHVIAHGAPGSVKFASGDWSITTLEDEAENFAAIGRALAADGELRLWSCDTAAGAAGARFLERLVR